MTEQQKNEWIEKRWGLACALWESCEKIGICRELCPNGGVDGDALDDQEEPENQEDQETDEIKARLLCVNEDKAYCETCLTRDRCIYLRTYNLIEKQQAEIKRLEAGIVRCKDCKHRPIETEDGSLEFPDAKCPCQNPDDDFYSYNPDDDWYCGKGERKDGDQDG